jgi:WD40 repeat protein
LDAQTQAETRRQFLSHMLDTHTVANATYNKQGKQPCDANTRTAILADIDSWIHDVSIGSQSFLWLTGDPGSGKSAITASVARECKRTGILWAQFFINRNNANTTDPKYYFPSIARQFADHIPDSDVALSIHDALRQNPLLVDDLSADQAYGIFLDALKVASNINPEKPVVVVIDGLDETSRPRLRVTADIFSKLFAKLDRPNAKVFISSRTEHEIQKPFSQAFDVKHVKHIHLDTAAESSIQDVSYFLRRRIADIVETNDLNWEEWPGEERMQALCIQASGLFIWAATVVKFFQEQIDVMGRECLNDLLDALSTKGMGDINVLYSTILRLMYKGDMDDWVFETFRRVVGCIVVLQEPLCLAEIEDLLDLRQTESSARVDIKHFVRRLRTVLVAGADAIGGHTVPRLHKSFFEFVTSERADSHFRVDMDLSNVEVVLQCLRCLANLRNSSLAGGRFRPPRGYALEFWTAHLPAGMPAGVAVTGSSITLPKFQELLQLSNDRGIPPPAVHAIVFSNRKHIMTSSGNDICLFNAKSGAPLNFLLRGHTAMVYSVAFSPDGKKIVSGSEDKTLRLWDAQSGVPIGSPFEGHTDMVRSVAFSPDGQQVVSGSSDHTVCLWDVQSGRLLGTPFKGHTTKVWSVAFSPDGKRIISASEDQTLRLWDVQSGQPIGSPFVGHSKTVLCVAFSPDGQKIISGAWDHMLRLWSPHGQPIGSPLEGHTGAVYSVAFSPDGKQIVSGSHDSTLRLWNAQSGQPIGSPFEGHTKSVLSVAFSPDGQQIISGSRDETLRLWDARSGQPIGLPFEGHTISVYSVAFSPDGKHIISGSADTTLRIWDVATGQLVELPFKGHTKMVTSIALSPNKGTIVSASLDDTVCVWNSNTGQLVGPPLSGDTKRVISLAISPGGNQFAAALSDSTIRLWETDSQRLLASYRKDCINKTSHITFSSDGRHLMTCTIDGMSHSWNATNGQPINSPGLYGVPLPDDCKPLTFSMKRVRNCEEPDNALLQWFPKENPHFGHLAYFNCTLIRRDINGMTAIIDMREAMRKR